MEPRDDSGYSSHVTGATGFIGGALYRELRRRGIPCGAGGREGLKAGQLGGVDVLYHCAGLAHVRAPESRHQAANFEAVLAQAEEAAAAGVRRFIWLSTVRAGREAGPYGYWKWRAEQELLQRHGGGPMTVICLRPALVYGPGAGGNLARLARAVRAGMPRPPASEPRSLVGINDLCEVLVRLGHKPLEGGVYTVTDGQRYDFRRICRALRGGLGRGPGVAWLPRWGWRLGCGLLDLAGAGEDSYRQLFGGDNYSNRELCAALDWSPRESLEDLAAAVVGRP